MAPNILHSLTDTRQFLQAMCAQAHSQLGAQSLRLDPHQAVRAQANLDLAKVLDLLRD